MKAIVFTLSALSFVALSCGAPSNSNQNNNPSTEQVVVANTKLDEACTTKDYCVSPLYPDELGQWVATKLTPAAYPAKPISVAYALTKGSGSDPEIAHKVRVFVAPTTDASPLKDPTAQSKVIGNFDVTNSAGQADLKRADGSVRGRVYTHALNNPPTLKEGESLYVAIQMGGRSENGAGIVTCIATCVTDSGQTSKSGIDFWSTSTQEPFAWADLVKDFGFTTSNNTIRATFEVPKSASPAK